MKYINEFVKTAKESGYIAVYNHPWWSMEDEADIMAYECFISMKMCNYSSYLLGSLEYNAALYDKIMVFTGSESPKKAFAEGVQNINSTDFEIDNRLEFVRVSIVDKYGRHADTRDFFRDELDF